MIEDPWLWPRPHGWEAGVLRALDEDLGTGDVSAGLLDPDAVADWYIEAQAEGVFCGIGVAAWLLGPETCPGSTLEVHARDGDPCRPGTLALSGRSPAGHLLSRERLALNHLMLLGGTATLTSRFVAAVAGTKARIIDTRKTIPNLRTLQKYAVRCGGGFNHRMGLYDAVMIKDNHIRVAGGIGPAVRRARRDLGHMVKIEVECESPSQAAEARDEGADVVLLDNMTLQQLSESVHLVSGSAVTEASGGISLETVRAIAETGVDCISVGALTHSAPALALHLEIR